MERLKAEQIGLEYAESGESRLRRNAATFLAELGTEKATARVGELIHDSDETVRDSALEGLMMARETSFAASRELRRNYPMRYEKPVTVTIATGVVAALVFGYLLWGMDVGIAAAGAELGGAAAVAFLLGLVLLVLCRPIGVYPRMEYGILLESIYAGAAGIAVGVAAAVAAYTIGDQRLAASVALGGTVGILLLGGRLASAAWSAMMRRRRVPAVVLSTVALVSAASILVAILGLVFVVLEPLAADLSTDGIAMLVLLGLPSAVVAAVAIGQVDASVSRRVENLPGRTTGWLAWTLRAGFVLLAGTCLPFVFAHVERESDQQFEDQQLLVDGVPVPHGAPATVPVELWEPVRFTATRPLAFSVDATARKEGEVGLLLYEVSASNVVRAPIYDTRGRGDYTGLSGYLGHPESVLAASSPPRHYEICVITLDSGQDTCGLPGAARYTLQGVSRRAARLLFPWVAVDRVRFPYELTVRVDSAPASARDERLARRWRENVNRLADTGESVRATGKGDASGQTSGEEKPAVTFQVTTGLTDTLAVPGSITRRHGASEERTVVGGRIAAEPEALEALGWLVDTDGTLSVKKVDCDFIVLANAFRRAVYAQNVPVHACDAFAPMAEDAAPELQEVRARLDAAILGRDAGAEAAAGRIGMLLTSEQRYHGPPAGSLLEIVARSEILGSTFAISGQGHALGSYAGDEIALLPEATVQRLAALESDVRAAIAALSADEQAASKPAPLSYLGLAAAERERMFVDVPLVRVGLEGPGDLRGNQVMFSPGWPERLIVETPLPMSILIEGPDQTVEIGDMELAVYRPDDGWQIAYADTPPIATLEVEGRPGTQAFIVCFSEFGFSDRCLRRRGHAGRPAPTYAATITPSRAGTSFGDLLAAERWLARVDANAPEAAEGRVILVREQVRTPTGRTIEPGSLFVYGPDDSAERPRRLGRSPRFEPVPAASTWEGTGAGGSRRVRAEDVDCEFVEGARAFASLTANTVPAANICTGARDGDAAETLLQAFLSPAARSPEIGDVVATMIETGLAEAGSLFEIVATSEERPTLVGRFLFGTRRVEQVGALLDPSILLSLGPASDWRPQWAATTRKLQERPTWYDGTTAPDRIPVLLASAAEREAFHEQLWPCREELGRGDGYEACLKEHLVAGDKVYTLETYEEIPEGTTGTFFGPSPDGDSRAFVIWDGIRPNGCFYRGLNGAPTTDNGRGWCTPFRYLGKAR